MKEFYRLIIKTDKQIPVDVDSKLLLKDAICGKHGSGTYSDYHGVGIFENEHFIIIHSTFPVLTEEKRVAIYGNTTTFETEARGTTEDSR